MFRNNVGEIWREKATLILHPVKTELGGKVRTHNRGVSLRSIAPKAAAEVVTVKHA